MSPNLHASSADASRHNSLQFSCVVVTNLYFSPVLPLVYPNVRQPLVVRLTTPDCQRLSSPAPAPSIYKTSSYTPNVTMLTGAARRITGPVARTRTGACGISRTAPHRSAVGDGSGSVATRGGTRGVRSGGCGAADGSLCASGAGRTHSPQKALGAVSLPQLAHDVCDARDAVGHHLSLDPRFHRVDGHDD